MPVYDHMVSDSKYVKSFAKRQLLDHFSRAARFDNAARLFQCMVGASTPYTMLKLGYGLEDDVDDADKLHTVHAVCDKARLNDKYMACINVVQGNGRSGPT